MIKDCGGFVDSRVPDSIEPGCERQASGVMVGVPVGMAKVGTGIRVWVGGIGVEVGVGGVEGEQAVRSARRINPLIFANPREFFKVDRGDVERLFFA